MAESQVNLVRMQGYPCAKATIYGHAVSILFITGNLLQFKSAMVFEATNNTYSHAEGMFIMYLV